MLKGVRIAIKKGRVCWNGGVGRDTSRQCMYVCMYVRLGLRWRMGRYKLIYAGSVGKLD